MFRKHAVAIFVIAVINLASGYSYMAWTSMTGEKTVAVNPFFYGSPLNSEFGLSTDLVAGYGFTPKLDLFANFASLSVVGDPGSYSGSWIMPRYDFGNSAIGALFIGMAKNVDDELSLYGGPQFHFFRENDNWALELNLSAMFYAEKNSDPLAGGTVAPVYKLVKQQLYLFAEFNPAYSFGDGGGFDFNIAPGLWLGIPETAHQFSLSIPLSGIKDGSVSAGINLWYWYSFSLLK
ncbi:MAG: hypothetical protein JNL74_02235 [Fibrobacteres bacterium]|nr:hypothetical protein [Fibrobacterota bacterium]